MQQPASLTTSLLGRGLIENVVKEREKGNYGREIRNELIKRKMKFVRQLSKRYREGNSFGMDMRGGWRRTEYQEWLCSTNPSRLVKREEEDSFIE